MYSHPIKALTMSAKASKFNRFLAFTSIVLMASTAPVALAQKVISAADMVNPRIGNANSRGQTVVGPTLPAGSIHPSPDSAGGGQSGYKLGKPIRGFSQTHVSGIGWTTYGNLLVSPQVGLDITPTGHDSPSADDQPLSYAYSSRLTRYNLLAELTPARHTALYRFTFPKGDDAHIMLDVSHQIPGQIVKAPNGSILDANITLNADRNSFSGSGRYEGGWGAGAYSVFFYGEIDQTPTAVGTFKNAQTNASQLSEKLDAKNDRVGGWWRFSTDAKPVQMKLAISFHSVEKAKSYLEKEIPGWDFNTVKAQAKSEWEQALNKIVVTGGSDTQRTQFYTALNQAQLMPRDRTGDFARFPETAPMWDDHFAIWDTWRTKYPLMTLINPELVRGTIASFAERLRVDGHVRDSMTAGNGGKFGIADQGGNDLDNIIADAYVKGVKGIDWEKAYGVLKYNADTERRGTYSGASNRPDKGTDEYRKNGWLPPGTMNVSNTLEYAYNDFAIAQVAKGLGKKEDAESYLARSHGWQYLFNPEAESEGYKGFIMPRNVDGSWVPDIDMRKYPGSWGKHFYEATTWGYTFFVPHQTSRLIALMGGSEPFVKRLEHGLKTGAIDYSNEPAFLAPSLFHYAGRPDLSTKWIHEYALNKVTPEGYPGDDDSGAMSSYYVWASIGLFPNAGQDLYFLNAPLFNHIVVNRPEGGRLTITTSGKGPFITAATLNDKPLNRSWVRHTELKSDARLHFTLGETLTTWGTSTPPPSDDIALPEMPKLPK